MYQAINNTASWRTVTIALIIGFILCSSLAPAQTRRTSSPPVKAPPPPPRLSPSPPAQTSKPAGVPVEVDDNDVISFETDLVNVPVVVMNAQGQPAGNLKREDFRVLEDGRAQAITSFAAVEAPFEVALLLDTSGSTRAELNLIRRAANAFIDALREGDQVAIIAFTSRQEDGTRRAVVDVKQELTDDRESLRLAVEGLEISNGTPYYDALETIAREVFSESVKPEKRGRRAVVALTDGVDSASDAEFEEAQAALTKRGVMSYFVQLDTESFVEDRLLQDCADGTGSLVLSRAQLQRYRRLFAPTMEAADFANFCSLGQFERMQISRDLYKLASQEMTRLTRATGGKTFPAADLRDARRAFALVAQEIGTQYSLGYYSTNKVRNGAYRKIRVEIPRLKGAQIQARDGYTAPRG